MIRRLDPKAPAGISAKPSNPPPTKLAEEFLTRLSEAKLLKDFIVHNHNRDNPILSPSASDILDEVCGKTDRKSPFPALAEMAGGAVVGSALGFAFGVAMAGTHMVDAGVEEMHGELLRDEVKKEALRIVKERAAALSSDETETMEPHWRRRAAGDNRLSKIRE